MHMKEKENKKKKILKKNVAKKFMHRQKKMGVE